MLASLTRTRVKKILEHGAHFGLSPGGPPEGQKGEANQIAGRAPLL